MSPRAAALLETFGFEDVRDYVTGKQDWMSRGLTVEGEEADALTVGQLAVDPPVLSLDMAANDAVSLIDHQEGRAGAVIAGDGQVVGVLTREEADKAGDVTVEAAMELGPKTYRANGDPQEALDYMKRNDVNQVVVSDPTGKLIGLLYRDDAEEVIAGEADES
jgi:predicted transcriptional regulator